MGAAAFLMAEIPQISYAEVMLIALIPAILYFSVLLVVVDLEDARVGTRRRRDFDLACTLRIARRLVLSNSIRRIDLHSIVPEAAAMMEP
jgi:TRAP-type uncharacterized transport system fused permease subunit